MTDTLEKGRLASATQWFKRVRLQLFAFENTPLSYMLDFFIYGLLVIFLTGFVFGNMRYWPWAWLFVSAGVLGWTLIEYLLHRYVLHGLQPFRRWHEAHHQQPSALISIPTIFSVSLFAVLVFVPAALLMDVHHAAELLLGMLMGYFFYAMTHHATHHWRGRAPLSLRRKRWHAFHHHSGAPICFGVTTQFWDHLFGTAAFDNKLKPKEKMKIFAMKD